MKLDSKKSKAAVKNSAVKQKKVKAKAANPAKAPKVKKTLNTKKAQGKEKVKYKIDTYSCFCCRLCKCYFKWFIS